MISFRNFARAFVLAAVGLAVATHAIAQSDMSAAPEIPIASLKNAYLQCERAAVSGRLGTDEIMLCSVIYEELKQRAFGGDFSRLKAWADEYLRLAEAELLRRK